MARLVEASPNCSTICGTPGSASLTTEPIEFPVIRDLIRARLALPGVPQMVLQFGLASTSLATARRPVTDFLA